MFPPARQNITSENSWEGPGVKSGKMDGRAGRDILCHEVKK